MAISPSSPSIRSCFLLFSPFVLSVRRQCWRRRLFAWRLMYIHIHIDYRCSCWERERGGRGRESVKEEHLLLLSSMHVCVRVCVDEVMTKCDPSALRIELDDTWRNPIVLGISPCRCFLISSRCQNESSTWKETLLLLRLLRPTSSSLISS